MNITYKKMAENRGKCRLSNRYKKGEIFNYFLHYLRNLQKSEYVSTRKRRENQ